MAAERSSTLLLIAIASLILLLLVSGIWWIHRVDTSPKPPMHSRTLSPTQRWQAHLMSGKLVPGKLRRDRNL